MDTASDKALQRFAELMIEKIKQVEDNWQKPWFGIKGCLLYTSPSPRD